MGQKIPQFPAQHWADATAPSLEELELLARQALASLPQPFASLAGHFAIHLADFPDDDVLVEMEAETPFDILGLFVGQGLLEGGASPDTGQMQNAIWLYRRPILDYWAEHEETLGAVVRHVFIHELGHHIGLSDEDMERIEAQTA